MSAVRTVSTRIREVATRFSWTVARTMSPVSPMPPAVAQNRTGSDCLVTVRTSPPGLNYHSNGAARLRVRIHAPHDIESDLRELRVFHVDAQEIMSRVCMQIGR